MSNTASSNGQDRERVLTGGDDHQGQSVPMTPPKHSTSRINTDRAEDLIKLVILVMLTGASLAATFRHMHDWTMHWLPLQSDWFGWVNAMIPELLTVYGGLSLRRRLRYHMPYRWPALVMLSSAVLSVAAQEAVLGENPSLSARFLVLLPAVTVGILGKMALTDLDIGRKITAAKAEAEAEAERQAAELSALTRRAQAEIAAALDRQADADRIIEAETRRREEAEIAAEQHAASAAETAQLQAETAATLAGLQAEIAAVKAESANRKSEAEKAHDLHEREVRELKARLIEHETRAEIRERLEAQVTGNGRVGGRKGGPETGQRFPVRVRTDIPFVRDVKPETVGRIVDAINANPAATQAELSAETGISERTIRKVQAALSGTGNPELEPATSAGGTNGHDHGPQPALSGGGDNTEIN